MTTKKTPEQWQHGSRSTYTNHKCRCEPCTAAHAEGVKEARAKRKARLANDFHVVAHGSSTTYTNWGCRCEACTAEHTRVSAERRAKAKAAV